jgi:hypothetical protein
MTKNNIPSIQNKLDMVRAMHNIILRMNNEEAYMTWIYQMPDEPSEDDFEWFADPENEESFKDLTQLFIKLCNTYLKDGLFINSKLYTGESS